MVTGNVVWGSPGWGIVHHDSHAQLIDNVVFDVVGAGIVAEDGNELGLWKNNLSVKATGDGVDDFDDGAFLNTDRGKLFDLGHVGSAYWLQGGGFGIRLEDNIAASSNVGIDIVHHIDGLANVETISVDLIADPVVRQAYMDAGIIDLTPNNAPTRGIDGFVAYNARRGIHTWLHNRDSGDFEGKSTFPNFNPQNFPSVIENYEIWNVRQGIHNFYSAQFEYRDGLIVGDLDDPVDFVPTGDSQGNNSVGTAISSNSNSAHDLHFDGVRVEGFEYGMVITRAEPETSESVVPFAASSLRNAEFANVDYAFIPRIKPRTAVAFTDLFVVDNVTIDANSPGGNLAPIAEFDHQFEGGGIVSVDATAAFDSDPEEFVAGDGIAVYAWDTDGDGDFNDAFGREARIRFNTPGANTISLKVWDDHGATDIKTVTIDVPNAPYADVLVNGDFSDVAQFDVDNPGSFARDAGWSTTRFQLDSAGFAESPPDSLTPWRHIEQVVRDDHLRIGTQTLAFEIKSIDNDTLANSLTVTLFGINDEWEDYFNRSPDPRGIGAVVADVDKLLDVEIGGTEYLNWTNFTFDVDLGSSGYEYLYVRFDNDGTRTAKWRLFRARQRIVDRPLPVGRPAIRCRCSSRP